VKEAGGLEDMNLKKRKRLWYKDKVDLNFEQQER
jgi:hypothetical protein